MPRREQVKPSAAHLAPAYTTIFSGGIDRMSFGGPTKYCPRCNTLLPVQATVCSTCGLQFSAPSGQGSGYGAAPYGGQSGPSGWPQSQPAGYPPPAQPGYGGYTPQGQFV